MTAPAIACPPFFLIPHPFFFIPHPSSFILSYYNIHMPWSQIYDPLNSPLLSTLAAILPAALLLISLGLLRIKAHLAALIGLGSSILVALFIYHMPPSAATASTLYGLAYGLLPVGWIILNVIFLYRLADGKGLFRILQASLTSVTQDRRLQLVLVAFCFGALLEGASGFGTPVAVSASILIGLGFPPLPASSLSLIANTVPVPFASVGTPLVALQAVTGLDIRALSVQVALQLSVFSLIIPFWLVAAFGGWKAVRGVWPALLVAGVSFTTAQLLITTLHGPWLVSIIAALFSLTCLVLFLRQWKPKEIWRFPEDTQEEISSIRVVNSPPVKTTKTTPSVFLAWMPWLVLSVLVFIWGLPPVKTWLDSFSLIHIPIPFLHQQVLRVPPVVPVSTPQTAIFDFAWLSASGTAILAAAIISGLWMGYKPGELLVQYIATIRQVRFSLLTIAAMMAIGFVSRYAGMDGTLGLAFARTGALFPFFSALLGWLGVAITGSDTSSNVLFGSLQRITAEKLGFDPVIMAAANSSGGVMGKMINAQSIVVASTATKQYGKEGEILRRVFWHSLALAALVGLVVLFQAYLF
jgi:lactate permease